MASKLPKHGAITLADGLVNYLFHHSPTTSTSTVSTPAPLVLIGGTAQTINSLVGHHTQLNQNGLLHYELRGQGRTTTLPLDDCSLSQHVKDVLKFMLNYIIIRKYCADRLRNLILNSNF